MIALSDSPGLLPSSGSRTEQASVDVVKQAFQDEAAAFNETLHLLRGRHEVFQDGFVRLAVKNVEALALFHDRPELAG